MLLLIDNYDSFTYNLYQFLSELGAEVITHRNDKITLEEIEDLETRLAILRSIQKVKNETKMEDESSTAK